MQSNFRCMVFLVENGYAVAIGYSDHAAIEGKGWRGEQQQDQKTIEHSGGNKMRLKKSAIFLLPLLIMLQACSDNGDQAAVSEQRKTEKKVTSEHKPKPSTVVAFDITAEKIPDGFSSIDPAEFYKVLRGIPGAPIKSEFETDAEFKKRTASTKRNISPLSFDSYYAFSLNSFITEYDANKKVFVRYGTCFPSDHLKGMENYLHCQVYSFKKNSQFANGRNVFGVEKQYEITDEVEFSLLFDRRKASVKKLFPKRSQYVSYGYADECSVLPERAKTIDKKNLQYLIISKVVTAKFENMWSYYRTPKISDPEPKEGTLYMEGVVIDPVESICYLKDTGEILSRRKLN